MATRHLSVAREPQARDGHAAVGVGQTLYVWGGDGGGTSVQASTVECLDVPSATWQEPRQLRGHPLPHRLHSMAVTTDGERAYSFGGVTGSDKSNAVYEVNMTSLECRNWLLLAPRLFPAKSLAVAWCTTSTCWWCMEGTLVRVPQMSCMCLI